MGSERQLVVLGGRAGFNAATPWRWGEGAQNWLTEASQAYRWGREALGGSGVGRCLSLCKGEDCLVVRGDKHG